MRHRPEETQDELPRAELNLGTAHARYVIALLMTLLGYGGNEILAKDRDKSELIERHNRAEDVMARRIEALENRLLNCGH